MLLRLTDDDISGPDAKQTALERKFSDVTRLFSALDPRLAQVMFGRLARAVLKLDPDRRNNLLQRTILPGLLDGARTARCCATSPTWISRSRSVCCSISRPPRLKCCRRRSIDSTSRPIAAPPSCRSSTSGCARQRRRADRRQPRLVGHRTPRAGTDSRRRGTRDRLLRVRRLRPLDGRSGRAGRRRGARGNRRDRRADDAAALRIAAGAHRAQSRRSSTRFCVARSSLLGTLERPADGTI